MTQIRNQCKNPRFICLPVLANQTNNSRRDGNHGQACCNFSRVAYMDFLAMQWTTQSRNPKVQCCLLQPRPAMSLVGKNVKSSVDGGFVGAGHANPPTCSPPFHSGLPVAMRYSCLFWSAQEPPFQRLHALCGSARSNRRSGEIWHHSRRCRIEPKFEGLKIDMLF